ncbi:hypothetical protein ABIA06_005654 [Bradyrhizobium yuanmingense]
MSASGQKLTLGRQRGKVSFGPEADKVTTIYLPHPRPFLASLITKRIPSTSSDGADASIILSTSRRAGSQSSPPDQRTKHDGGSHRGVTTEHHEAHAPALCGHEDAERQQQHPCTGSPKSIGRHPRQRLAENIALLAVRGESQRSKARQTQPKGKQMDHSAAPLEAMVTGTCGMRFDCTMDRFRAVRTARTTWSNASAARHVDAGEPPVALRQAVPQRPLRRQRVEDGQEGACGEPASQAGEIRARRGELKLSIRSSRTGSSHPRSAMVASYACFARRSSEFRKNGN